MRPGIDIKKEGKEKKNDSKCDGGIIRRILKFSRELKKYYNGSK